MEGRVRVSEAVEGMAWVPGAGRPRHDGRQKVRGLVVGKEVGLSSTAVVAGSMELTAYNLQWISCGCGTIRTW